MSHDVFSPSIVYHPSPEMLPVGFRFPQSYLEDVNQKEIAELYPWYFMCHVKDTGYYDRWLGMLKEQYPDRQLVPFAKWGLDDDIACFEPSDDPALPGIHIIHSFTDPGWEERGFYATFEEWLEVAMEEAKGYQADFPLEDDFEDIDEE